MSTLMEPLEYQVLFQHEEEHWWFVGMRRIFRVWVEDRLRGYPCRILDAGCGTGRMVQELASWDGARACGVELSDLAVGLARRRTAAPLARGDVLCLPFKPKSFDLVTSFDVLPNLQRPQHVAAVSDSMTDPYQDLELNCRSHLTLLEACRRHNPRARVVHSCSRQVYGRPRYLPAEGEIFNLGGPVPLSLQQIAETLPRVAGRGTLRLCPP